MTVVIGKNKQGEIVFIRREADGTVIVLSCEDLDSIEEVVGSVIAPSSPDDAEKEDDSSDDGVFPLDFLTAHRPVAEHPLRIDISELPRGVLLFSPSRLAEGALAALEAGQAEVRLDERSAREFGFTQALSPRDALER